MSPRVAFRRTAADAPLVRAKQALAPAARAGLGLLAAAVVLLPFIGGAALLDEGRSGSSEADESARAAAQAFLDRYVQRDGRVVRPDQGGDTVSEGQSYGLVIAQVAGDEAAFRSVWAWTKRHLQRPDGLLASRADARIVRDPMPASDADLVTAWALQRASGPDAAAYRREGLRIASAVLTHETTTRGGTRMLAAGPWATGSPVTLNPSYWTFTAFEDLGRETGDARWDELASGSLGLVKAVSEGGGKLPPDWARVDGTSAAPTAAPNGQAASVQYSLDAQRTVVWLAAACDPAARRLAAGWWPTLSEPGRARALALAPDGAIVRADAHAMALVAAAAAAGAGGRPDDRDRLLDEAARVDAAHPTYYGAAWVAIGRAILTTRLLGGCASEGGDR
jgi:endo-1,4-beta-D-glucanase Y